MTQENLDVVITSNGSRRVVRDILDIADASDKAGAQVGKLQKTLDSISLSSFQNQLRAAQQVINQLGSNNNLSQFQAQIQSVTTALQQMNQQMNGAGQAFQRSTQSGNGFLSWLGSARGMMQSFLGILSVKKILDWADAWVAAAGKINTLARNQAEANVVLERVYQIAQQTRAPLANLAQLYHQMTIAGQDLGASQNQMLRVTETVSKVLAIQGTSFSQARGALLQLSQSFNTGRVRAQEFNSMMQNAPLLLKVAAQHIDGAGGSVVKLRQLMLAGRLSSEEFFQGILKASKDVDEMFKQAPQTFGQAFTVLTNAIEKYLGKINESTGASKLLISVMMTIGENLDTIGKLAVVAGAAIATAFAPQIFSGLSSGIGAIATGFGIIAAHPFGALAVAIVAAVTALVVFDDKLKLGTDNFTTLMDLFTVFRANAKEFFQPVIDGMKALADKYLPGVAQALSEVDITFVGFLRGTAKRLDEMDGALSGLQAALIATFEVLPSMMDNIGGRMFNAIVGWVEQIVNKTIDGVNRLGKLINDTAIQHISFERAKVDEASLKAYGKRVSDAFAQGIESAGNPVSKALEKSLSEATIVAENRLKDSFRRGEINSRNTNLDTPLGKKGNTGTENLKRAAMDQQNALRDMFQQYQVYSQQIVEAERHKEVLLKAQYDGGLIDFREYTSQLETSQDQSFESQKRLLEQTLPKLAAQEQAVQEALSRKGAGSQERQNQYADYLRQIQQVMDALGKLKDKQEEVVAQREAAKAKPFVDFGNNMERQLSQMDAALLKDQESIAIKRNINQLDEKGLFIQQEQNRLMQPYKDALAQVLARLEEIDRIDPFGDSEMLQASRDRLLGFVDQLKGKINEIPATTSQALAEAFDAGKISQFSKELGKGLADALLTAGKDGGAGLRKFLEEELLKKPFRIIVEALLKPITDALAGAVTGVVNTVTAGIASSGGIAGLISGAGAGLSALTNGAGVAGLANAASLVTSGAGSSAVIGGVGMAAGVAIPVAAIAYGLYKLFSSGGGGPKQGAYVGAGSPFGGLAVGATDQRNASIEQQLNQTIAELNTKFEAIARLVGKPGGTTFGFGVSTDPAGKSASFLEANARNSAGQSIYSNVNTNVGRSAEAIAQAIADQASAAMNAALAASGIDQAMIDFATQAGQQVNGATAAAIQVNAVEVAQLQQTFLGMGVAASNLYFLSEQARQGLIDAAGGLSQLQAGLQAYYTNFFTEEEQRQALILQVNSTLASAGVALNAATATREEFRNIAQALDVTTAAGQAAFAAMMGVAGAFAQITDNSKALAAQAQAQAQAEAEAQRAAAAAEQERMRAEMEAQRQQAAWEAEQARIKQKQEEALNTAKQQLQAAYQKESSALQDIINSAEQWRDTLKNMKNDFSIGGNSPLTPQQKYQQAITNYNQTLTGMSSSDPKTRSAAQGQFQGVAQALLETSRVFNASSSTYTEDFNRVMADIERSTSMNDHTLSVAEQQLNALNQQVQGLIDINNSVLSVAEAIRNLSGHGNSGAGDPSGVVTNLYNKLLGRAPDATGMAEWTGWLKNGASVDDVSAGIMNSQEYQNSHGGPAGAIREMYSSLLQRTPQQWEVDYWTNQYSNGMSLDAISKSFRSSPEYLNGVYNSHAGGMDFIPRDNYLFRAHYGEAVLNQGQADAWRAGSGHIDLSPLIAELTALRREVCELKEQHRDGVVADIATNKQALAEAAKMINEGSREAQERVDYKRNQRSKAVTT